MLDKNKQEIVERLQAIMRNLPSEAQEAMNWLILNCRAIGQSLDEDPIPKEKIEEYLQNAKSRNDYFAIAVLVYAEVRRKREHNKDENID